MNLSKAIKKLILHEPFYGIFAASLHKEVNNKIPTAGVSKHNIGVKLAYNEKFFNSLTDKQKLGILKHELLHVSLGHLIIRDKFSDKKIFNIAADLEINQYIDRDWLPDNVLFLSSFPDLNLPVKAGTKVYYDILIKKAEDGGSDSLNNLLDQMDGNSPYCHETWNDFNEVSDIEKKLIKKQLEHQIQDVAREVKKSCGRLPGEVESFLERIKEIEPPKFDWRGYLKRFIGSSTIRYTKKLRRKYNKRYADNPGLKIKSKNHVLVGIDTSGSVSNKELIEFFKEIHHMYKTGHKITIVQCDTKINSIKDYNPHKDWTIHGRGGTYFQPVIDHYNEKKYYNSLIYLTDGEAGSPTNCPKNTLWVLSSHSNMNNDLPGRVIKLN